MPLVQTRGAASAQGFGEFAQATAVNYIEDVFSTYLYTGNGSTQTITNNIDLSTKGGLVWIKDRTNAGNFHVLTDTVRGTDSQLRSNSDVAADTEANRLTAFSSSGFSIGASSYVNTSAANIVSWTFREQPKFFDVVTWSGNGTAGRNIAHNLGSVPGCIIVKRLNLAVDDWRVYHRSLGNTSNLVLNLTAAENTGTALWNSTTPTSTVFTVGNDTSVNSSGGSYVAYLFAHDAGGFGLTGTDNVISCGSYTGTGAAGNPVTLGYEPQWLLIKRATGDVGNWNLFDNMRGFCTSSSAATSLLLANTTGAESTGNSVGPTATGFEFGSGAFNNSGSTFIYIAIRRGPMKVPTTGTSVFSPVARTGTGAIVNVTTPNFAPDLLFSRDRNSSVGKFSFNDKLRGPSQSLYSTSTAVEITTTGLTSFNNLGYTAPADGLSYNEDGDTMITECFQRAPSFFDEVCYTGTGVARTLSHNLAAVPEMMIVKIRGPADTANWAVYHSFIGNTAYVILNSASGNINTTSGVWNNTTPTSSVFSLGSDNAVNITGQTYVAYLFATCAGVSKVGNYTGNGSSQTINCGFTGGARFILIKKIEVDVNGDWYLWDSARGIVAGNDPYLSLNTTAVEVTSDDSVDTDSTGFVVNQVTATNVNVSSKTYIFLAIA